MRALSTKVRLKALVGGVALGLVGAGSAFAGDAPGENLEKYVGTWDIKAVMRTADAEQPVEIDGVAYKELVGGNWVVSRFEADFYGVEFEGQDVYGYDQVKEEWAAVWVDSMSEHAIRHSGEIDETGDLTMVGRNKDAATGEWVVEKREDKWISADEFDTTFVTQLPNGDEYRSLTIHHKRAEAPAASTEAGR